MLVCRRSYWNKTEGCMKFKYTCAKANKCGCKYYVYVNFKRKKGTIEEPVNNVHNNHERTNTPFRVHATAEQKALMNACIRDGAVPVTIMKRLREEQLGAGLDLRYVQRYKTNHKDAILGQGGFLGTMSEYEELFDAFPVEETTAPGTAGVVDYSLDPENGTIRCIVSSRLLLDRLSTEIVPGVLGWCVDGTYKLNREAHVTVPIGVFDMHRKFYFCAFAIVPGPGENEDDFSWIAEKLEAYISKPGFPLTNNGIESKNRRIKEAFGRSKMHIRDSIRVLAGLLESEVVDFAPEYNTSFPELSRVDYVRTDTYMRNHINGKPSHRIEIDHERTLYPTRAFLGEIDNVLKLNDSTDEERAREKERIIMERVEVFRAFYERTMIGGHAPATDEPTHKFKVMSSLARAFNVVTKLPLSQCSDTVLYSCTCVRTSTHPKDCSYGKHRKCKHVFVEGWKRGTLLEREGFTLIHQRVTPGRPARMPPALVRETPAAVVNQFAAWGLPVPGDA